MGYNTTLMQRRNFWDQLPKPVIGLSPMDGITDQPYRYIQKKYGRPAVVFTEFTSVEGVCHGATRLLTDFLYDQSQRPVVAQIYGTTPEFFQQTATLLCELGFDGIDINMGCPAKNVEHSGAGAALIEAPALAQEIIRATKVGVTDWQNGKNASDCESITAPIATEVSHRHLRLPPEYQQRRAIPVSVKTRVGYRQPVIAEWIPTLLEMEPAVISLHGRTLSQHYSGQANWELIGQAAEFTRPTKTLILGNGDITGYDEALEKIRQYGTDGALLGRATFGNPYALLPANVHRPASLFEIALEHAYIFENTYADQEKFNFMPMRKHLGWYVKGIPRAAEVRKELFQAESAAETAEIFVKHGLVEPEGVARIQESVASFDFTSRNLPEEKYNTHHQTVA